MEAKRRNSQLTPNATEILEPGTLVLRIRLDITKSRMHGTKLFYEIVHCLDDQGRVYKIRPSNQQGTDKNINRMEFNVLPATTVMLASPPPKRDNLPNTNENDLDVSEDESEIEGVVVVNIRPLNSEASQQPTTYQTPPPEDPPVIVQPEPQLNPVIPSVTWCSHGATAG